MDIAELPLPWRCGGSLPFSALGRGKKVAPSSKHPQLNGKRARVRAHTQLNILIEFISMIVRLSNDSRRGGSILLKSQF